MIAASLVAVGSAGLELWLNRPKVDGPTVVIAALLSGILVGDRFFARIESKNEVRDAEEDDREINQSGLLIYADISEALKSLIVRMPQARHVNNTVFRYNDNYQVGKRSSSLKVSGPIGLIDFDLQQTWLRAKENHLKDGSMYELCSSHFSRKDRQVKFAQRMLQRFAGRYGWLTLNEDLIRPIQMTILTFREPGTPPEVWFGWNYPNLQTGPCFRSANQELVGYFQNYFAELKALAEAAAGSPSGSDTGD